MRTKEELQKAVSGAHSMAQVVRRLGLIKSSKTYKVVQSEIEHYSIKTHFKSRARNTVKYAPEEIYCKDSTYDKTTLRKRIIKEGTITYECQVCGISEWRGKEISLQLDHINGTNSDNRIENLRFLCPNCHTQTSTWGCKRRV